MNSSVENNAQRHYLIEILDYTYPFTDLIFCILTLVVLCYYVRRRYLLARDIKNISKSDFINPCYQNYLKNLRIKSMISTFIIIILSCEFLYNFSSLFEYIYIYVSDFLSFDPMSTHLLSLASEIFNWLGLIAFNCIIAIPCLLMKVLWLAYLHWPYSNTVKRWSVYIAVRCVGTAAFLLFETNKISYHRFELVFLFKVITELFLTLDFVLYLFYARRFYMHLKSRETEARLFKDRASYRSERGIRLHFKVASILTTTAISFFVLAMNFRTICNLLPYISLIEKLALVTKISQHFQNLSLLFFILFTTLMSLNYLYFVTMLLGIYLRQKWRRNRVNEKIKPIVAKYHAALYYRRC